MKVEFIGDKVNVIRHDVDIKMKISASEFVKAADDPEELKQLRNAAVALNSMYCIGGTFQMDDLKELASNLKEKYNADDYNIFFVHKLGYRDDYTPEYWDEIILERDGLTKPLVWKDDAKSNYYHVDV